MKIEYFHASKYGNGATVAMEFSNRMTAKGATVNVHHIDEVNPKELPPADLYLFSSPGRMGRPIGSMRRFLKKVRLPAGTRYAILATAAAPQPDKKTGRVPTEEEMARWRRVIPIMDEILKTKGLVSVAADEVLVRGLRARWRQAGRTRSRRSRPDCPSRPRNPIRRQAPGEGASSMSGLYEPLRAAELSSAR